MIDLHSHVLPGLDDGAADLEQGVAMMRLAAEAGTTDIVATPHADLSYRFDAEAIERASTRLTEATGGKPRLHIGCELHVTYDNVIDCLGHPSKYAIAGRNYVLVELPQFLSAPAMAEVWERMQSAGIVPVLAHPERNPLLQSRPEILYRWIRKGCLAQVTAASFLGRFGRRAEASANNLLHDRQLHFVASDAHDCESRPPMLDAAFAYVSAHSDTGFAWKLFRDNPASAIRGEALPNGEARNGTLRRWLTGGRGSNRGVSKPA